MPHLPNRRATIVVCCAMLHVVIAGATRSITSRKVRDELINSVSSAYSISGGQHRCRLVDVVEGVSVDIVVPPPDTW